MLIGRLPLALSIVGPAFAPDISSDGNVGNPGRRRNVYSARV
jgi:hypothetical protein